MGLGLEEGWGGGVSAWVGRCRTERQVRQTNPTFRTRSSVMVASSLSRRQVRRVLAWDSTTALVQTESPSSIQMAEPGATARTERRL